MSGHAGTGAGPARTGCAGPAAGFGSRATGDIDSRPLSNRFACAAIKALLRSAHRIVCAKPAPHSDMATRSSLERSCYLPRLHRARVADLSPATLDDLSSASLRRDLRACASAEWHRNHLPAAHGETDGLLPTGTRTVAETYLGRFLWEWLARA